MSNNHTIDPDLLISYFPLKTLKKAYFEHMLSYPKLYGMFDTYDGNVSVIHKLKEEGLKVTKKELLTFAFERIHSKKDFLNFLTKQIFALYNKNVIPIHTYLPKTLHTSMIFR